MTRLCFWLSSALYVVVAVAFAPYIHELFRPRGWSGWLPPIVYTITSVGVALLVYLSAERNRGLLPALVLSLLPPVVQTGCYLLQDDRVEGAVFLPAMVTLVFLTAASVLWSTARIERTER